MGRGDTQYPATNGYISGWAQILGKRCFAQRFKKKVDGVFEMALVGIASMFRLRKLDSGATGSRLVPREFFFLNAILGEWDEERKRCVCGFFMCSRRL